MQVSANNLYISLASPRSASFHLQDTLPAGRFDGCHHRNPRPSPRPPCGSEHSHRISVRGQGGRGPDREKARRLRCAGVERLRHPRRRGGRRSGPAVLRRVGPDVGRRATLRGGGGAGRQAPGAGPVGASLVGPRRRPGDAAPVRRGERGRRRRPERVPALRAVEAAGLSEAELGGAGRGEPGAHRGAGRSRSGTSGRGCRAVASCCTRRTRTPAAGGWGWARRSSPVRASHTAARAWVGGESAELDEVAGEGYAVMTLEWGPRPPPRSHTGDRRRQGRQRSVHAPLHAAEGLDGTPHVNQAGSSATRSFVASRLCRSIRLLPRDTPVAHDGRETVSAMSLVRSRRGGPDSPWMIGRDPVGGDQRVAVPPPLYHGGIEPGLAQLGVVHHDDLERTLQLLDALGQPAE